jgi:hypothetical protein
MSEQRLRLAVVALLLAGAALSLAAPQLLAARFSPDVALPLADYRRAALAVASSLWAPLLACAVILALRASARDASWTRGEIALALAASVVAYVGWARALGDWIVDDAGITFAYARNVVLGHGLVIVPGHAPEEGYSNTAWLLLLVAADKLGLDIPTTAKSLGLAFGAAATALTIHASLRLLDRRVEPEALVLGLLTVLGAPFLVWSASGLEHGLQGLLLLAAVVAPIYARRPELAIGLAFAALALTRPETPALLGCVAVVFAADLWRRHGAAELTRLGPLVVPPGLALAGLFAFRWLYFGDLQPNPYYAKAGDASPAALLNLFGGGWPYVSAWAASSGVALVLPQIAIAVGSAMPLSIRLALAVLAGQLAFVVGVRGDWMGEYRFVSPILPVLALVVVWSFAPSAARVGLARQRLIAGAAALVMFLASTAALADFAAAPTTPFALVGRIGSEFMALGQRLGVAHPSLAHHDAGGTTYTAGIDLVDLGGLTDRALARHMRDRAWVLHYLLDVKRPTFVFGSAQTFAAGRTHFFEDPAFRRDYLPLEFEGKPFMAADLCFVRRDALRDVPGVHVVARDGEPARVRVDP